MSAIHFFTDIDLLEGQTAGQAFGPFTDATAYPGKDCFRFTDRHRFSGEANAYAVCNGIVLVQAIAETNLVNIVLKPEDQPSNCPPVKFYVYRGIQKSSLVQNSFVIPDTCTLTHSITQEYADAPQKILGLDLTEADGCGDNDKLETAFYRSFSDFVLWPVKAGWSLGEFDMERGGFEIMLDAIGFNPTFALVRQIENVCTVATLTGSETDAGKFDHWHQKEQIHNYLDPAAFYGNIYGEKLKARKSTATISDDKIPDFDTYKKDEIYQSVLYGESTENFYNRNVIYIDIRNEFNMSYNYFGNYADTIKISYVDDENEPDTLTAYKASNWPLLQLTDLPDGNDTNTIKIAFPIGDNTLPLAYVSVGTRKIDVVEKIKQGKSRFMELTVDTETAYTSNFVTVTTTNADDETNTRIASYIRILYLKRFDSTLTDAPASSGSVLRRSHYRDMLFRPKDMTIPFTGTENLKIKVFEDEVYIDALADYGIDYMAKIGIAQDADNTYLFAIKKDLHTKNRFKMNNKAFSITSEAIKTNKQFLQYKFGDTYLKKIVTINNNDINIVFFSEKNGIDFFRNTNSFLNAEVIVVILPNESYNRMITLLDANFTNIAYLSLQNKTITNGIVSFNVFLKGLNFTSQIVLQNIDTTIKDVDSMLVYGKIEDK